MAGEIKLNGTTALTESGGAVTLNNVNSATNRTNLGLGSFVDTSSSQTVTNKTLGSGVVFPAGHILQLIHVSKSSNTTINITSSFMDAGLNTGTITQKQSGSKFFIQITATTAPAGYTSSYRREIYVGWNTSNTGVYTGISSLQIGRGAGSASDVDTSHNPSGTASYLITAPSSSFTIYLTAQAIHDTAGNYIGGGNYKTEIIVMELAQ